LVTVEQLSPEQVSLQVGDLIGLLQDGVESGASISFLPPLSDVSASLYWRRVAADILAGERLLITARVDGSLAGSVQLALALQPNAPHRAEVQKLMVHTRFRRQGIGQLLVSAAENAARQMNRTLLVLDTRRGDAAESLYEKLGYIRAGVIPQYALSANGTLDDTVIFYRTLA
jgi:ribosomal protein S18 acetylase RimI-like enzyme